MHLRNLIAHHLLQLLAITVAGGFLLFVGADSAAAQNGVTVDPDSPAGKEYAIPIEQTRQDAAPPGGGADESDDPSQPAPAFGVGVGEDEAAGSSGGASSGGSTPGAGDGGKEGRAGGGQSFDGAAEEQPNRSAGGDRGVLAVVPSRNASSDTLLWSAGGAVLVLVLGLAGGFALRRVRHS